MRSKEQLPASTDRNAPTMRELSSSVPLYGGVHPLSNIITPVIVAPALEARNDTAPLAWSVPPPHPSVLPMTRYVPVPLTESRVHVRLSSEVTPEEREVHAPLSGSSGGAVAAALHATTVAQHTSNAIVAAGR
jgi:hypothetical protein